MKPGHVVALFLALAFSLATVTSLYAAGSWVVIKDKNGVCKIIESKERTPATIAGPFKTKKEAEKAKDKECPKGAGSTLDKIKEKAKQEAGKIKEKAKQEAGKIKEKVKESVPSEKK